MVGIPTGTNCAPLLANLFLYSYENEFLDKLIRKAKKSLLESSIYHTVTLMTLSLTIRKDLRSSFLIFTPKNSQFLKPQNLLQLLLSLICFSSENNQIIWQTRCVWLPHCELSHHVKQYSISTSLWCLCISAHSLCLLLLNL